MARISLEGVGKRFGEVQALAPTSLTIDRGQFIGVLGPSGCGKTTLLRCLAGLEHPDAGTIRFDERVVFDASSGRVEPPHRRGIGMVFQDLALWPHLSVFENVAYTLRARRDTADLADRVHEALAAVRLPVHAERFPHQLSGGQQQRVAFARAIVDRPAVLMMDEPLSALDAALRVDLRAELTTITRQLGLTAVYVTHDQHEAMSMADRILVMEDGHVRQDDAPEIIYRAPATRFVADFVGRLNPIDRGDTLGANGCDDGGAAAGSGVSVGSNGSATASGSVNADASGDPAASGDLGASGDPAASGDLSAEAMASDEREPSDAAALALVRFEGAQPAGVRPEKVRLSANGGGEVTFDAEVELTSFLGDRYELRCRLAVTDRPWVVYSDERIEPGARVQLHVHEDDLIRLDV